MRKIKSSYSYGRTGKHGLKRRSKNNTSGAFGKPRKKRKICKRCGIDPLDCLKRNIAKLAGRQERGTLAGNGDER